MVVLAPWSSLTLPSGRAKPLVRGEGNPAACPQEESWVGQWPSGLLRLVRVRSPNYVHGT